MKILSQMYLWTKKNWLNFGSHPQSGVVSWIKVLERRCHCWLSHWSNPFRRLNASSCSQLHCQSTSLRKSWRTGSVCTEKCGMNLETYVIIPRKRFSSERVCGVGMSRIAAIFSLSGWTPSADSRWSGMFPSPSKTSAYCSSSDEVGADSTASALRWA